MDNRYQARDGRKGTGFRWSRRASGDAIVWTLRNGQVRVNQMVTMDLLSDPHGRQFTARLLSKARRKLKELCA